MSRDQAVTDVRGTAQRSGAVILALRVVGAALLLALAGIHLYLWQQGYRTLDVIGPAFLLDTVCGIGGALLVLFTPLRWLPVAAILGALLTAGTLAALVVTTTVGLFGFIESTAAPLWWVSVWVEAAGTVVLVALAAAARRRSG
jgi:hypothetical protein